MRRWRQNLATGVDASTVLNNFIMFTLKMYLPSLPPRHVSKLLLNVLRSYPMNGQSLLCSPGTDKQQMRCCSLAVQICTQKWSKSLVFLERKRQQRHCNAFAVTILQDVRWCELFCKCTKFKIFYQFSSSNLWLRKCTTQLDRNACWVCQICYSKHNLSIWKEQITEIFNK